MLQKSTCYATWIRQENGADWCCFPVLIDSIWIPMILINFSRLRLHTRNMVRAFCLLWLFQTLLLVSLCITICKRIRIYDNVLIAIFFTMIVFNEQNSNETNSSEIGNGCGTGFHYNPLCFHWCSTCVPLKFWVLSVSTFKNFWEGKKCWKKVWIYSMHTIYNIKIRIACDDTQRTCE